MALTQENIYQFIRDFEMKGNRKEDLEALLVNDRDLHTILDSTGSYFSTLRHGDDVHLFSVKIIESHHIPEGSIFKILKKDKPQIHGYTTTGFNWKNVGSSSVLPPVTVNEEEKEKRDYSKARKIDLG